MKLLFVLIFAWSFSSQALESQSQESKFDALGRYFSVGAQPEPNSLVGWFSGRCYHASTPNTPYGNLLVSQYHTPTENNGPLFPVEQTLNMVILGQNLEATFYDNMSYDSIQAVRNYLLGVMGTMPALAEGGSLVSYNHAGNLKYVVRKYQDYILAQSVVSRDVGSFKAGDIYANCYFFKKID